VRLATWNVQTGLESTWGAIEALDADVLAVQEVGSGTPEFVAKKDGWACEWQPGRWDKGQAILARSPYRIESREPAEPLDPFVSSVISGPDRFRFVGFWAMTPKDAGYSYPQQAARLIERLPDDGMATVIAGDFNAQRHRDHLANVETLKRRGLVNAYHAFHGLDPTAEVPPTSFHRRQESSPHHMDFVFVPATWLIDSVEIGTFEEYAKRGLSDHVPVVVSISTGVSSPGS
jgi:endonuclease/exonuclease/phosphatase family metal-dependent hydrolase